MQTVIIKKNKKYQCDSNEIQDTNKQNVSENLEKLKSLISSEKENAIFQTVTNNRASYLATQDQLTTLLTNGKKDEALKVRRKFNSLRETYQAALQNLDSYILPR